jgi:hypothetical protein
MTDAKPSNIRLSPLAWAGLISVIIAIGIGLRTWRIGTDPMWLDEAYSAYAAAGGWHFLWTVVPRYETHPPFYYSLLRLWTLIAGDGLLAHRMLGLICGVATIPLAAWATRNAAMLAGQSARRANLAAVAALALAAVAPMLVRMTRDVRPYPVMILVYTIAILALIAIARRSGQGRPLAGRAYTLYLVATGLMLWLHSLGPLYGVALGLALLTVLLRRGMTRADWLWLIGGHFIVGLCYAPALAILLDQAPTWIGSTWLKFGTHDLWRDVTGIHAGPGDEMRIAALVLVLAGLVSLWRSVIGRRIAGALLILGLLPVLLSILISATIAPVFISRTMAPLAVPAVIAMGVGTVGLIGPLRWATFAAFVWLIAQQVDLGVQMRRAPPMQDWYRAIAWIQRQYRPGDVVFAYPNEGALPFDRAVRDLKLDMPSVPIPSAVPTLNPPPGSWYPTGSRGVVSLDKAHLQALANAPQTRATPTIWLLRLGPWAYDKGDVLLDDLSEGRTSIGSYEDGPIIIDGLRRDDLATPGMHPIDETH